MDEIQKVIEGYHQLLKELDDYGASEAWQLRRRMINTILKIQTARRDYHDARAKHGIESPISAEERESIKEAVELRKQIYRRRKEMIKQGQ